MSSEFEREFEKAYQKFDGEMKIDAQMLDSLKRELEQAKQEVIDFKKKNTEETLHIREREIKIKADERKENELVKKITELERKQVERHAELERLSRSNRERLEGHGAKLEKKYF